MYKFKDYADNRNINELMKFKELAEAAHQALKALDEYVGDVEVMSEYLGTSYSNIEDEIENLSLAMDSRIEDLKTVTISQISGK